MKVLFVALLLNLSALCQLAAQPGRTGLGLRGSVDGVGLSVKYFIDKGFAFEGQLNAGGVRAIDGRSYYSCILIEYHLQLPFSSLRLYFGGGAHGGWWSSRPEREFVDEGILGLDGVGGIEYLLPGTSLGISGDVRPSINYVREVEFLPHNLIGISVRYYFGSNKAKPYQYPTRVRRQFKE